MTDRSSPSSHKGMFPLHFEEFLRYLFWIYSLSCRHLRVAPKRLSNLWFSCQWNGSSVYAYKLNELWEQLKAICHFCQEEILVFGSQRGVENILHTATFSCNVGLFLVPSFLCLHLRGNGCFRWDCMIKTRTAQWPRLTPNNDFPEALHFSAYITLSRHMDPSPWNRPKSISV